MSERVDRGHPPFLQKGLRDGAATACLASGLSGTVGVRSLEVVGTLFDSSWNPSRSLAYRK